MFKIIKLQYLEKEDLKKIVQWNANKSADYLLQWAGPAYTYPLTLKQVEEHYFDDIKRKNSNILAYKIQLIDTNEIVGTIELREIDKKNKVGRICRFLIGEENVRGNGIGTLALKEILRIGFTELNFEKITLGVFDFNLGAIKCYENAGFVKEKFLESTRKAAVGYWNIYEMSILKAQWQTE
ncbi:Protein N-acetyltransferase, RimJ/RimL family [Clostridium amylolyticum]|uniref:Protein N-acetyltransferase, RimJ/RimL family n=1 Tax=Clostridium amylolyticum TaxID=1121298 RepID=A0A1M6E9T4_9CLOT|nr:GNAT family protein [Clostridium amylolyticum]SHI82211.1 Protein N-acetyltransferase, RimJ/RimL family [Clostridium amylolyticum]